MTGDLGKSNGNTSARKITRKRRFLSLTGFTLVEITIALLILAVGLVGILSLFPVGFDASARAASVTEATFLAQGLMENLKREGYDDGDGDDTTQTTIQQILSSGNYQSGTCDDDYYEFEIHADDSMFSVDLQGSIVEVTVNIFWPADAGGPEDDNDGTPTGENRDGQRNVELVTYIANYEP